MNADLIAAALAALAALVQRDPATPPAAPDTRPARPRRHWRRTVGAGVNPASRLAEAAVRRGAVRVEL
jgi:hypothetical protein